MRGKSIEYVLTIELRTEYCKMQGITKNEMKQKTSVKGVKEEREYVMSKKERWPLFCLFICLFLLETRSLSRGSLPLHSQV